MPSGSQVTLVSQRWVAAGCGLDEPARRAIVSAVLHEIERPGATTSAWVVQLYAFDPSLAPSHDDIHHLRAVLRDTLAERDDPAEAARLQHRAGIVVDDLVAAATQRRLDALEQTARVDALTSLGNRRAGEEALERAIAHARRRERRLAVAMIDLDGLKRINDTEGHLAGDEALRRLGASLTGGMRTEDAAYRFGGDEFVVVAPETSADELLVVLERIRRTSPAFSVGVAELAPDVRDSAALLDLADEDLYRRRRGEAAERARRSAARIDPVVPLVAVAVGVAAAMAADGVRRLAGIEIADQRWLWSTALGAAPVVLAASSLRYHGARGAQLRHVLRGGGLAVLALVAALTPLVSGTIERRTAPRTGGLDPDRSAAPRTTTTTVVDELADDRPAEGVPGGDVDVVPAPPSRRTGGDAPPAPASADRPTERPPVPATQVAVDLEPVAERPVTTVAPRFPGLPLFPITPELGTSRLPDTQAAGQGSSGSEPTAGPPRSSQADEHGRGSGPALARAGQTPEAPPGWDKRKGSGGRGRTKATAPKPKQPHADRPKTSGRWA